MTSPAPIRGGSGSVGSTASTLRALLSVGALICVLLLRGPQTTGELKGRSERWHDFSSLDAVEDALAALAPEARWRHARQWILAGDRAFFAALRRDAPLMRLPQVTVASRFSDCEEILRRHDLFGVSLYAPKQGDYFMAQDDTAQQDRKSTR